MYYWWKMILLITSMYPPIPFKNLQSEKEQLFKFSFEIVSTTLQIHIKFVLRRKISIPFLKPKCDRNP